MTVFISGDFCPNERLCNINDLHPSEVFGNLTDTIINADLSITNLECPLTNSNAKLEKTGPNLKSSTHTSHFLKQAGFNLVTLANNHINDYGAVGIKETIESLDAASIDFVGAGMNETRAKKIYYFNKEDQIIALLNFCENEWSTTTNELPGANPIDPIENSSSIKEAKAKADFVIVIVHGGHEMYNLPSPRMKKLFRFYIDAGADVVINHHTHCVSGYEIYNNAPIFYSLGNFLFDNKNYRNSNWNNGLGILLNIENKVLKDFDILFLEQCNERPQVHLVDEQTKGSLHSEIQKLNEIIQDDELLKKSFEGWVKKQSKLYNTYIEPHKNRYIYFLQNRKLFPSFWTPRKRKYLLNLIRCESHKDILQSILENEDSHTQ